MNTPTLDNVHALYANHMSRQLKPKYLYLDPHTWREMRRELEPHHLIHPHVEEYMGMQIVVVHEREWMQIGIEL